ncbi:hypothetical protein QYQ99_06315 [Comamonas testosteroni]|uniref:hypothetical protein n=1 Tax=Comamonas testosteroni TaxID=285 RepID=UPI00265DFC62|nr:hypothetical protein [Comamonas testosteroni]WKL17129.1 hypothetical protein QYQ99_06315 [Comamonas testosteroni]
MTHRFRRSPCLICDSTIVVHVISGTESAIVKTDFHEGTRKPAQADFAVGFMAWVNMDLKSYFHNFKYEK